MPIFIPNTQTGSLINRERGTHDNLVGANDSTVDLFGDAYKMFDYSIGGNDTLAGGSDQLYIFRGDAFRMAHSTRGGNDTLVGGLDSCNIFYGDADTMLQSARGGNDTLIGGDGSPAGVRATNFLHGDAYRMSDNSRGGSDTLVAGKHADNVLVGDAGRGMAGNARGGNDRLFGPADVDATNLFIGDAYSMMGYTQGGADNLDGRALFNRLFGDAVTMWEDARGGNDTLRTGRGHQNELYGDAETMSNHAVGGNDRMVAQGLRNVLFGDADTLVGSSRGGHDVVEGGRTAEVNILYGDARNMSDNAHGGNDRLISTNAVDHMWGDAAFIDGLVASPGVSTGSVVTGADRFVFLRGNGNDFVSDFRRHDNDKIDVSAYGFQGLIDMAISVEAGNTRISFSASDSVTLIGVSAPLRAADFVFA